MNTSLYALLGRIRIGIPASDGPGSGPSLLAPTFSTRKNLGAHFKKPKLSGWQHFWRARESRFLGRGICVNNG